MADVLGVFFLGCDGLGTEFAVRGEGGEEDVPSAAGVLRVLCVPRVLVAVAVVVAVVVAAAVVVVVFVVVVVVVLLLFAFCLVASTRVVSHSERARCIFIAACSVGCRTRISRVSI